MCIHKDNRRGWPKSADLCFDQVIIIAMLASTLLLGWHLGMPCLHCKQPRHIFISTDAFRLSYVSNIDNMNTCNITSEMRAQVCQDHITCLQKLVSISLENQHIFHLVVHHYDLLYHWSMQSLVQLILARWQWLTHAVKLDKLTPAQTCSEGNCEVLFATGRPIHRQWPDKLRKSCLKLQLLHTLCVLCTLRILWAHLHSLHDNGRQLKLNVAFVPIQTAVAVCLNVERHKAVCHSPKGNHCGPNPVWKAAQYRENTFMAWSWPKSPFPPPDVGLRVKRWRPMKSWCGPCCVLMTSHLSMIYRQS